MYAFISGSGASECWRQMSLKPFALSHMTDWIFGFVKCLSAHGHIAVVNPYVYSPFCQLYSFRDSIVSQWVQQSEWAQLLSVSSSPPDPLSQALALLHGTINLRTFSKVFGAKIPYLKVADVRLYRAHTTHTIHHVYNAVWHGDIANEDISSGHSSHFHGIRSERYAFFAIHLFYRLVLSYLHDKYVFMFMDYASPAPVLPLYCIYILVYTRI